LPPPFHITQEVCVMKENYGTLLWYGLVRLQKLLMIISGVATIALVFVPMVLREIGIPFVGYEEFLLTIAFWMYMMGSSYGSYEKSQISADILSQFLTGWKKVILLLVNRIGTFILGVIFTYWGFVLIQWTLSTGATTSTYKIPIVIGQSSIFFSLLLTSFYNFVYMIEDIKKSIAIYREHKMQKVETKEAASWKS